MIHFVSVQVDVDVAGIAAGSAVASGLGAFSVTASRLPIASVPPMFQLSNWMQGVSADRVSFEFMKERAMSVIAESAPSREPLPSLSYYAPKASMVDPGELVDLYNDVSQRVC